MQHIPLTKENFPEQFELNYGSDNYLLRFDYNLTYDYFTVSSYKIAGEGLEELVIGEKIVLEKPLWSDMIPEIGIGPNIVPLDLSGLATRVDWDNFGKSTFLYVDDDITTVTSYAGGEYEL